MTKPNDTDELAENQQLESAAADSLSDDMAKKYDPERLLKMMSSRAGRGDPLDQSLRNRYERKFGVDLGHVRILTGAFAEKFNRDRNANAVTIGSTGLILMAGNADKSMAGSSGRALLAHELTHVAQAKRGLHFSGGSEHAHTNELEKEAQHVEHEEATGKSARHQPSQAELIKQHEHTIAKIQERVIEMMGDAGETQITRAGNPRRA
jgi:hypothetical protein